MIGLKTMWSQVKRRFCSCASRRAEQALAAAAWNRKQRERAVENSHASNRMMSVALKELQDALQRTSH